MVGTPLANLRRFPFFYSYNLISRGYVVFPNPRGFAHFLLFLGASVFGFAYSAMLTGASGWGKQRYLLLGGPLRQGIRTGRGYSLCVVFTNPRGFVNHLSAARLISVSTKLDLYERSKRRGCLLVVAYPTQQTNEILGVSPSSQLEHEAAVVSRGVDFASD